MKKKNWHKQALICCALLLIGLMALPQDSAKKELLADLAYFMPSSRVPYLIVNTKTKVERKFLPVGGIVLNVYIDSVPELLAKVTTDKKGTARIDFPASMKSRWDASPAHNFIAVTEATMEFDEVTAEISITKARLIVDTVPDAETRSIRARVMGLGENGWQPAADVELKVGVRRLGGDLPVGEEESYTTDSTGEAIAEFKRADLPGDTAGNIILIAKVEDNEQFGNLAAETSVAWGVAPNTASQFHERTLWASRDKAPAWLLFTAMSIVVIVWGTIVFLLWQIIRIRKLGIAGR